VLNVRLLVATVAVLLVLGPAVYFAKALQVRRSAESCLARAEVMEGQERWSDAVGYLQLYAKLRPDSLDVHARIAQNYDRQARRDQDISIALFYRAVGVEPQRGDLRRRLLELLLQSRRWSAAEIQARALEKLPAEQDRQAAVRAFAVLAVEQAGEGNVVALRGAQKRLEEAHRQFPGDVQVASLLAVFYRDRGESIGLAADEASSKADAAMDEMVAASVAGDETSFPVPTRTSKRRSNAAPRTWRFS
jgi:hypothetical protein